MEILLVIGAFALSFLLVIISVPPILRVAKAKKLYDNFNERKVHTAIVPPLGGVAIFIGFVISTIIATESLSFDSLKFIIAAVILMFFIGLKDDLLDISARKKLMVQLFAAIIMVGLGHIHFTNLHGILGIYEINELASHLISFFAVVVIINAFNLIDGIDGLASGVAIIVSLSYGVWFYLSGNYALAIMAFALIGSLSGFFLYNVFGNSNKLFMGDTGSLVVGIVISTMVVRFNELNIDKTLPYVVNAAPAISFAIIVVPLIDTLRVMSIRIAQKRSPFSPDKNHVHHRLLTLYQVHIKVTGTIVLANIVIIGLAIYIDGLDLSTMIKLIMVVLIGICFSLIPSVLLRLKKSKELKLKAAGQNV